MRATRVLDKPLTKKTFKYYVFRMGDTVIFRKTAQGLKKVKSVLRRPNSELAMVQVTVIGGILVGTMPYKEFYSRSRLGIDILQCKQIERTMVKALMPFIISGE